MYVYRWEQMRELIERFKDWDGDPYEALSIEYIDPLTGGPVFKTMTFFVQMLRPGERTRPVRQTASLLVAPFEGKGTRSSTASASIGRRSTISRCRAAPGSSTSTAPTASRRSCSSPATSRRLKCFHLFKKWGRDAAGDVVKLA